MCMSVGAQLFHKLSPWLWVISMAVATLQVLLGRAEAPVISATQAPVLRTALWLLAVVAVRTPSAVAMAETQATLTALMARSPLTAPSCCLLVPGATKARVALQGPPLCWWKKLL